MLRNGPKQKKHREIVSLSKHYSKFEDVHEIVELAVDVAAKRELFAVRNIQVNQCRNIVLLFRLYA